MSGLVARCGIGPSTVQNSLARKWDTKLQQSGSSVVFAEDVTLYGSYRSPQGHEGPRTRSIRTETLCSPLTTKNVWFSHFWFSPNSEKRCLLGEKRHFGSSEGYFDRKVVPQESESASIRSARRFSTNPCLRGSRDLLSKTNNAKNPKNVFGQISHKTCTCPK